MDRLTERLKEKKPEEEEEEKKDPGKKEKIMGMHAEGDEINLTRCESCGNRFPANELQEKGGRYYCPACASKLDLEE